MPAIPALNSRTNGEKHPDSCNLESKPYLWSGALPTRFAREPDLAVVFISAPYLDKHNEVREDRINSAWLLERQLIRAGVIVYNPLKTMHRPFSIGEGDESYWRKHRMSMLQMCDVLVVLEADGWQTSHSVRAEVEMAEQTGIPVFRVAKLCKVAEVVELAAKIRHLKRRASGSPLRAPR